MSNYRILLLFALASLVIFACNLPGVIQRSLDEGISADAAENTPVATNAPTQTEDSSTATTSCLFGTWEMGDLSPYILAAIPQDMAEQYNLAYQGANGRALFTLSPDGNLNIQADKMEMLFEAQASILKVPISVKVDGEAVGKYRLEANRLTTLDVNTSGLSASAQAFGNDLIDSTQILDAIPLLRSPFNTAEFTCVGDRLQLRVLSYPEEIPPLVLNRVK